MQEERPTGCHQAHEAWHDRIEREMVRLLNPTSPTRLSEEGNTLLNLYAAEGFKLIQERMMAPAGLEEFLVAYYGFWHAAEPPVAAT